MELEKFDAHRDFDLWKYRVLLQLRVLGLDSVLKEILKETSDSNDSAGKEEPKPDPKRDEKDSMVKNLLILSLSDQVLRRVMKETTALGVWNTLEKNYQPKSLLNRIYLKYKLFSFKMNEHKTADENLDVFLKLVSDLSRLDVNITDEDEALYLLNSLPKQYDSLRDTLINGRKTVTMNEVTGAAYSKDLELKEQNKQHKSDSRGLYFQRGRSTTRDGGWNGKRNKSRSKSRPKNKCCWICGSEYHFKRQCPKRSQYYSNHSR